jgi:hypothetical protein
VKKSKAISNQNIEHVRRVVKHLRTAKPFRGQTELLQDAEHHLALLEELHGSRQPGECGARLASPFHPT